MVTIKSQSLNSFIEHASLKDSYPLRTFGMSNQANHLFFCEESFEACAIRIIVSDHNWSTFLPDDRLGAWEYFCKQSILVGSFNLDMTTTKLGVATRLNQILVTSDLIVHSISCAKLDKAIHCLGGRAFHDYVHSTAERVVLNDVS